jgi:carbamate kinase
MPPALASGFPILLAGGHTAAIGALADIGAIVRGEKGTLVDPRFDGMTFHR